MKFSNVLLMLLIFSASFESANASSDVQSGRKVYEEVCSSCHAKGVNGAPKPGDQQAWASRAAVGIDNMSANAIKGIRLMPAHGGKSSISDLELSRAIAFMVNPNGGGAEVSKPFASPMTQSAQAIVAEKCADCHSSGKNGAPRIGAAAEWAPRLSVGVDKAVINAIRGHKGMPSRGGLDSLSDAEMRSAALFMFKSQSQ